MARNLLKKGYKGMGRRSPIGFASVVTSCLLAAGCATPPQRVADTPSGRPEVIVNIRDPELVKGAAISEFQVNRFVLTNSAPYSLQFERKLDASQAMLAQFFIGNAYSTTPIANVTLSFASEGSAVRVFASSSITTQMAFGQVRTLNMDGNNAWFNDIFGLLQSVKRTAELQHGVDPNAEAPVVAAQVVNRGPASGGQAPSPIKSGVVLSTPPPGSSALQDPFGVKFEEGYEGLRVASVVPNHAAHRAGLKAGDIVTHLNGRPLSALYWSHAVQQIVSSGPEIILTVQRKGDIRIRTDIAAAEQPTN
jgi:hypothetical protein